MRDEFAADHENFITKSLNLDTNYSYVMSKTVNH